MNKLLSVVSKTFSFAIGAQKLGQPVPDSNLVLELNLSLIHILFPLCLAAASLVSLLNLYPQLRGPSVLFEDRIVSVSYTHLRACFGELVMQDS